MPKKSKLLFSLAILNLLIVSVCIYFIQFFLKSTQNDARYINELGIIRGSIQRVTKLELGGVKATTEIDEIDGKIRQYLVLSRDISNFSSNLESLKILSNTWNQLKNNYILFELNPSNANRDVIIQLSEDCWKLTNRIVLKNQNVSEGKVSLIRPLILVLAINGIFLLVIVIMIKRYVHDNLEINTIHDPLTHAFNRRYLDEFLKNEISRVTRKNKSLSIAMFDIDHFKRVNDTYGHDTGDQVLKTLSQLVTVNKRKHDVLARFGGEEFVLVLPDTGITEAIDIAERIRKACEKKEYNEVGRVTISLGVTQCVPGDTQTLLIKRADQALYRAKEAGRNKVNSM